MNPNHPEQQAATLPAGRRHLAAQPGLRRPLPLTLALASALVLAGAGLSAQEPPPVTEPPAATQPPAPETPEVRELSVPPQPKESLLPADAPGWIHETEDLTTSVHRLVVASLPVDSAEEAASPEALDEPLVAAVNHYLGQLQPPVDTRIGATAEEIRNHLLDTKTSYLARLVSGEVTQFQKFVVLNITPAQRDEFQRRGQALEQRDRLAALGLSLAAILGLTGLANRWLTRRSRRPS